MNITAQSKDAAQLADKRKSQPRTHSREHGWSVFLIVVTLFLGIGWIFTSSQKYYKPGDNIGYNMGLVGGIMLLSLLLYPLRKRVGFLRGWGILPTWFKWHMILGILAPSLILLHSTFRIGSINAGMALIAMMLVSGSGIFGRFFYTKIHNGLYGRKANLKEVQDDMAQTGKVKSILSFAPEIEKVLEDFSTQTAQVSKGGTPGFWHFITIGVRAWFLKRKLTKKLHLKMYVMAIKKEWDAAQIQRLDLLYAENIKQVENYIEAVRDVAQFHTYERMFSWWHIFHIPLVYLLVFSGVFHVISVHMY